MCRHVIVVNHGVWIMKTLTRVGLALIAILAPLTNAAAQGGRVPELEERFHITGCEADGELAVPLVKMWDRLPDWTRVVGRVSGNGREDRGLRCQGAVVIAKDIKQEGGRTFIQIQTLVRGDFGWITDSFVGRRYDSANCVRDFGEYADILHRCRGVGHRAITHFRPLGVSI